MSDLNPQAKQMADESMVRNAGRAGVRHLARRKSALIQRYGRSPDVRILDAGCGTGERSSRLAEMFPHAQVLAVDIIDHHLALARERYARLAPRRVRAPEHLRAAGRERSPTISRCAAT